MPNLQSNRPCHSSVYFKVASEELARNMPLRSDKNFREIQDLIMMKNRASDAPPEIKDEVLGSKKDKQIGGNLMSEQTLLSQARHLTRMGNLDKGFDHIREMNVDEDAENKSIKLTIQRLRIRNDVFKT